MTPSNSSKPINKAAPVSGEDDRINRIAQLIQKLAHRRFVLDRKTQEKNTKNAAHWFRVSV